MSVRRYEVAVFDCNCCGASSGPAPDVRSLVVPRGWRARRDGKHFCEQCPPEDGHRHLQLSDSGRSLGFDT